ncbi:hypothetical protein D9758_015919 [Tetrapyrgos nigripes]|uniref:Uncharacterized protein n=1 Tax=Tetrapyrgos nigripes TaxID=182062 RepID=A0A8H5CJ90_9AGAR|nr:hypothetical protein D9758_015919 [Tetrapyrgos nigripes]
MSPPTLLGCQSLISFRSCDACFILGLSIWTPRRISTMSSRAFLWGSADDGAAEDGALSREGSRGGLSVEAMLGFRTATNNHLQCNPKAYSEFRSPPPPHEEPRSTKDDYFLTTMISINSPPPILRIPTFLRLAFAPQALLRRYANPSSLDNNFGRLALSAEGEDALISPTPGTKPPCRDPSPWRLYGLDGEDGWGLSERRL